MILVTGSNGMFGWGIKKSFYNESLLLTDRTTLDITNINDVMKYRNNYPLDGIIHLAAETDHERAEFNPSNTYLINHTGTMNMVQLAKEKDIPIVYIGTCGMFDGNKSEYYVSDIPNPLNHYSRSKYYGEECVLSYKRHYIVRSGWAFGGGPGIDKKFVNKIYKQIKSGVSEIYAIDNVFGSPTYTLDFCYELYFITKKQYGIYHVSNTGRASRYDVAKKIAEITQTKIPIIPISHKDYHEKFGLKVPYTKCEVLAPKSINDLRHWEEALEEYINNEGFI